MSNRTFLPVLAIAPLLAFVSTDATAQVIRRITTPPALNDTTVQRPDLPMVVAGNDGQVVSFPDMTGANKSPSLGTAPRATVGALVSEGSEIMTLVSGGYPVRQNRLTGTWERLSSPAISSVAYDREGRLVSSGCGEAAIFRRERNGTTSRYGTKGTGIGQFECPEGVTVDAQGRIYIADLHRVIRVDDLDGRGWVTLGSTGSGANQFLQARKIVVDRKGRIYVADYGNARISRTDDMNGAGWTSISASALGLTAVYGIAVDVYDRLYVADAVGNRIVRVDNLTGANKKTLDLRGTIGGPAAIWVRPPVVNMGAIR